jgi:hypothetical protein
MAKWSEAIEILELPLPIEREPSRNLGSRISVRFFMDKMMPVSHKSDGKRFHRASLFTKVSPIVI